MSAKRVEPKKSQTPRREQEQPNLTKLGPHDRQTVQERVQFDASRGSQFYITGLNCLEPGVIIVKAGT